MTTWAYSPTYGQTVALGPTQAVVYRFVMGATEHDRRPTYTLARIAEVVGKPVSSVHEALGRLRALGLIGCASRMGRTGGHRLWRVASRVRARTLDVARHRRAVARVLRRWALSVSAEGRRAGPPPGPTLWPDPSGDARGVDGPELPARVPSGPSFRERIGLHHRLPWETEDLHGSASQPDTYDRGTGPGGARARASG